MKHTIDREITAYEKRLLELKSMIDTMDTSSTKFRVVTQVYHAIEIELANAKVARDGATK